MNASMCWRLVWKEYRVQRAFWLVVMLFAVAIQAAIQFSAERSQDVSSTLFLVAVVLAGLKLSDPESSRRIGQFELGVLVTGSSSPSR